jgi:hypothetical protein
MSQTLHGKRGLRKNARKQKHINNSLRKPKGNKITKRDERQETIARRFRHVRAFWASWFPIRYVVSFRGALAAESAGVSVLRHAVRNPTVSALRKVEK